MFFALCFLEGFFDHFAFDLPRHYADAIEIAEDDVARLDFYTLDFNGAAVVDDLAARTLILCVAAIREAGEVLLEDAPGVARVTIHDGTHGSAIAGGLTHQFTPERISGRGTAGHIDFVLFEVVKGCEHQAEGLIHHFIGTTRALAADIIDF